MGVKWITGCTVITGNEEAGRLINSEAQNPSTPEGVINHSTASIVRKFARCMLRDIQRHWWSRKRANLSQRYNQSALDYDPSKILKELRLPRAVP